MEISFFPFAGFLEGHKTSANEINEIPIFNLPLINEFEHRGYYAIYRLNSSDTKFNFCFLFLIYFLINNSVQIK